MSYLLNDLLELGTVLSVVGVVLWFLMGGE
jgi:hypothetical protein